MKIFSWNVNGIRAASRNGFGQWFEACGADIVCIQEAKATPEQLDEMMLRPGGFHSYWNPAQKPGYSGVAMYSKIEPISIQMGMGVSELDSEGRVMIAEFPKFHLINAYFPNSQREHARLPYKLKFCEEMLKLCNSLVQSGKNVILCGDYNIAHQEIDLKNPKSNMDNAGFLPEERAWMDKFLSAGYVDTFRHFEKGPGFYTWWSYRPGVREKNVGWRLDYHCVNQIFLNQVKAARIHSEIRGSDHCPVEIELYS
jgi:exodeoxyribonuclease-3